ncbi:Mannose or cellobiose epimerase, N-acyl-D-glucosamine 2-epimerase family [Halogranum amylolyticum]|uniref:Mannose or cellobiose epimerase, N-acyl-D-glucosamine 2-epimerase family n=1 Tax=Halogranum amylolyticum TaxID=660520 RepID=A0A1H8S4X3_9EURY|nr:AGE family epimerase/isomerase [Halogranum amylolyticum]SEO73597.1 Mannose or cellobiose epimerase, N-acyl-D-glucosamine 2-epimerase family [Halogranum amylolyticum]
MTRSSPDFGDPAWLRDHRRDVLEFYYPTCMDEERGGYVAQLDERTGEVYDPDAKHLVATCRFIVNFCRAARDGGPDWTRSAAEHGVEFLLEHHRNDETGGYRWLLEGTDPVDDHYSTYGHAFVLLALAEATTVDVDGAREALDNAFALVDRYFWEPEQGLCRSDRDADWGPVEQYRGQNANMHMCEAQLAAYEATDDGRYLDRARRLARRLTVDLAERTDGRLWEHYDADWTHDMEYNVEEKAHQFRPWGYQPGHHAEWAKLLTELDGHVDASWPLDRAEELFAAAVDDGWDEKRGGFYYTHAPDGDPIVADKYGWPVAEAIGAAAVLADATGERQYREWYGRFWAYATEHLVAPGGNWYTKLTVENEYVDTDEGPAVEPGYHPIGACEAALASAAALQSSD